MNYFPFITILLYVSCLSQTNIKGKVSLPKNEYYHLVAEKTKVYIKANFKSDEILDSTIVNKNLEFHFYNVLHDSVNLFFKPRNYPYNISYNLDLKKNKVNRLNVKYSPVCMFAKSDSICPKCNRSDKVIPIIYGLVILKQGHKDGENVKLGGCVRSGCDPQYYCKRNKYRF